MLRILSGRFDFDFRNSLKLCPASGWTANQSPGCGEGTGSKSPAGSNAFRRVSWRPSVLPMALSLSAAVGGLKFIGELIKKIAKIVTGKR